MLIVGTLQKRVSVKFLHLMSDGAKQNIDCRRSYMAFYILSDNNNNDRLTAFDPGQPG